MTAAPKYTLDEITIRIADVNAEAREMYGEEAEDIVGRSLEGEDLRIEVIAGTAGRQTRITFGSGYSLTAEDIVQAANR